MNRIVILWYTCKLEILLAISALYASIGKIKYKQQELSFVEYILGCRKMFHKVRNDIGVYRKEFVYTKHIVLRGHQIITMSHIFLSISVLAWLCEKMKVNLKIKGLSYLFSNDLIINSTSEYQESHFKNTKKFVALTPIIWIGIMYMRSEYGNKILSKLSIREDIRKRADEWFANHIKGDWVAVHFRGTDCRDMKTQYKSRCRIKLEDYIDYLKAVLDKKCSILVCSDQAQFIDEMHIAFPKRVFARDIQRSYDNRTLHKDPEYSSVRQKKDALIDMLILAKANLVYTSGSGFIDALRFLNPVIKIVSLDERWLAKRFSIGRASPHGVPIPRNDLLEKFRKSYQSDL